MKKLISIKIIRIVCLLGLISVILIGCGSSGSGLSESLTETNDKNESGLLNGTAIKGPVADALVKAFSINAGGMKGNALGTDMTDEQGNFSISVGDHSGPVLIEMTGGHYLDEATGENMEMSRDYVMTSMISSFAAGETMNSIMVTPLSWHGPEHA